MVFSTKILFELLKQLAKIEDLGLRVVDSIINQFVESNQNYG